MPENKELQKIILSALLHDIGKFAQRARHHYSKDLESDYLPSYKGQSSHWHGLYTDYFIDYELPLPDGLVAAKSEIARLAAIHHNPHQDNCMEMCVAIADRLSAGTDRIKTEDSEAASHFRESRLISIFNEIELVDHEFKPPGQYFYHLNKLDPASNHIFPETGKPVGDADEYAPLFEDFLMEAQQLDKQLPFHLYLESLIALLEKYLWAVPSSAYGTLADISLFDHSFTTAGIAQALFVYQQEAKNGAPPLEKDSEEKFILLNGDLSGIQKYIFDINKNSGKGLAKLLRARSAYLQTLTRSIILSFQQRTGLYSVHRLIDSGGKFMLLLPNTRRIRQELEAFNLDLQTYFRQHMKGLLTLPLTWDIRITQQDITQKNFRTKLDEANDALDHAKLKKLNATFGQGPVEENGYDEREGGNCRYCGIHAADPEATQKINQEEETDIEICYACYQQIVHIGANLPKRSYVVYSDHGEVPLFDNICLSLEDSPPKQLEQCLYIETFETDNRFPLSRIARRTPVITGEEIADKDWSEIIKEHADHEDTYFDAGDTKTFSLIAEKSRKPSSDEGLTGRPLLGFLKADVDNLGFIFSLGLGDRLSVSRLANLSRMLDLFFSGYLVELIKNERFQDIYVVFAGGDDLFLIGPWNTIIAFAIELREKFADFCAQNPDITISAGILPAKPRMPVRKAAEQVETQLEDAKKFERGGRGKDAVCFLEQPLEWEKFKELINLGEKFDKAVTEKERTGFSNAFLYRMFTYHKMYKRFNADSVKNLKSGVYLSHAHYDIARNIRRIKGGNEEELALLYDIFSVGMGENPSLENLHIPLFYAMNLNRKTR
ncbi:MAG: type III-A CRISPR-associated protein Cas10/Csm1 [Thermodesulfobacteriota bacterium]|nr:type III-A CRISPR-associated protein Cas10/Csm1 [Thermodesulfobacteriota bacterium]